MLPSRSEILVKAINIMNLISIEQWNEEGNALRADPFKGDLSGNLKTVLF